MLTAGKLQRARFVLERTLPSQCTIHRDTATEGSLGRPGASPTTVGTVACRINPLSGNEAIEIEQVTTTQVYQVTLPAESDIGPGDRITSDGRTFQVVGGTGERSWEVSRRVFAEERNEGL